MVRSLLAIATLLASLVTTPAGAAEPQRITIDGGSGGRTYDGIGALSAGASSRLLIDYPEPQRSQILDYMFKPGYGAALQILKVEIGGDTNSTDGSEPSHMRTPTDLNCNRGYEWWLMEQAKKRNPNIALSALQWGAPGWTGDGSARPTVWTQANADYLVKWLDCARSHDLNITYLGGWNEAGFNAGYYEKLRATLNAHGYRDVKIVADDGFNWNVVQPLADDPAFNKAVDVVGQHYVCGYLSGYEHCPSPDAAKALGKPLMASEQGSLPYDSGAVPLARAMNRQYIDGAITGTINWSLIGAWYDTMPFQASGLMGAVEPWSGAYDVGASIWVMAQTAQFTQPGWRYVDSAKGYLPGGGTYVALRSPSGGDYSLITETIDATEPQQISLDATGGLSDKPLHVWETNLKSGNTRDWFVRDQDTRPGQTITLQPGRIYSLSTTSGQGKGTAVSPPPRPQPLPYSESFDEYRNGQTPRYISDLDGAFEAAPCSGRTGNCLRQQITSAPVWWNGWLMKPLTLVGDLKSWRDYTATVDARPKPNGWTELLGRVDGQFSNAVSGIHLRLSSDGQWRLYDENLRGQDSELCQPSNPACAPASGPLAGNARMAGPRPVAPQDRTLASGQVGAASGWHRLALSFSGTHLTAAIDGKQIASVEAPVHASGQVGLGVSPWQSAEFDNLRVDPAPTPGNIRYLDAQDLSATATAFHEGYEARKAVDGSAQSMWHTEWDPKASLPQSITVDTGAVRRPVLVTYQPREDGNGNGVITRYELSTSVDGVHFTTASTGTWQSTPDRKAITLNGSPARYLRLTAIDAVGGYGSAAEIQVAVPR